MENQVNKSIIDPQLQHWVIEKIQNNRNLKLDLAKLLCRSENTINKYVRENNEILCRDYTLPIIAQYLSIDAMSLIEKRKR